MRPYTLLILPLINLSTIAVGEPAHAHGGLNRLGCHNNHNQGGLHSHRGKLVGRTFASKTEARIAPSVRNRGDCYNNALDWGHTPRREDTYAIWEGACSGSNRHHPWSEWVGN